MYYFSVISVTDYLGKAYVNVLSENCGCFS